eukprot:1147890-Pelagomonas_calceolata.AAC.4
MRELLSWWELTQGFESEPGRLIGVSVGFRHHVPAAACLTGCQQGLLSVQSSMHVGRQPAWLGSQLGHFAANLENCRARRLAVQASMCVV